VVRKAVTATGSDKSSKNQLMVTNSKKKMAVMKAAIITAKATATVLQKS